MHYTSVYYHIPKCGGTSIGENAKLNFGRSKVCSVYEKYPPENLSVLDAFDGAKCARLIKTHVPFGSIDALNPYASFVVLREPESRLISLMQDIKTRRSHYLFDALGGASFEIESFLDKAQRDAMLPHVVYDRQLYAIARAAFDKRMARRPPDREIPCIRNRYILTVLRVLSRCR